ncbi:exonuclease mut-7 homolog isoform X6 [Bubalus bubalis]|uniref:exonuclease mut-7 homolog isoform X6 n=1 Tax=Bubalus bubalis TaxID=89462 RepID=UPI001D11D868|nr:exonuclease mut-7 homolog isoform X6 [Bubalus bubalis]
MSRLPSSFLLSDFHCVSLTSVFFISRETRGRVLISVSLRSWLGRHLLREEAWKQFATLDNPLTTLLDMLDASRGCGGRGPSLEAWVARELERWLQAQPHPGPAQGGRALKPLQARAVRLLTEGPPSLVEPLVSIFQLQDADRSPVLAHIHRLHQEGKFKEAIVLGTKLQLQADLDVEKMCVPLLLQDKVDLAERYVDSLPHLQRRLLALMDSWCQPGFDIRVIARQYPQATLRLERLSPRALGRHVLRLLEHHSLDPTLCPNAVTQQHLAALRYLCYKRLVERSMSQESWAELVQGLLGQDERLQEQLLQLLASQEDVAMVAQCALDLSLPAERLPATVVAEMSQLMLQEKTAEAPSEDRQDDCYRLPIARDDIYFLASWEELARHEDTLLQPGQVVGVDLEWRPSFGTGGRPRVSLMQVAVEGRVFLLDLPRLSSPVGGQGPHAFSRLVSRLLSDPSITKLGYGMAGDLRSLGASCPALAQAGQKLQGGLDLLQVHRQMRVADRPAPAVDGAAGLRGLSLLVQQVLGKPLDKTQQLSNWDRRPLGERQLVYAAADAYCLLEVYWALCREPARFHLPGALPWSLRLGHSKRHGTWEPPLQQASASPWQVLSPEDAAPEVPARAFRVVCDNMLRGLGRTLRCLGVDVRVLHSGEDHRQAAECALRSYLHGGILDRSSPRPPVKGPPPSSAHSRPRPALDQAPPLQAPQPDFWLLWILHASGLVLVASWSWLLSRAWCFPGSSVLQHLSVLQSFLQSNNIPSDGPKWIHPPATDGHPGCCDLCSHKRATEVARSKLRNYVWFLLCIWTPSGKGPQAQQAGNWVMGQGGDGERSGV